MKWQVFYQVDPISIIVFLIMFRIACDNCGILERAAVQFFLCFVRESTVPTLPVRLSLKAKESKYSVIGVLGT